jgi:hypothetical protein
MTDQDAFELIRRFVESIDLSVQEQTLPHPTFLPGLELISNGIAFDPARLLYPGDLLHEAGHLAVTKNDSTWLIEQFESGSYIGLPLLEWMGYAFRQSVLKPQDKLHSPTCCAGSEKTE